MVRRDKDQVVRPKRPDVQRNTVATVKRGGGSIISEANLHVWGIAQSAWSKEKPQNLSV